MGGSRPRREAVFQGSYAVEKETGPLKGREHAHLPCEEKAPLCGREIEGEYYGTLGRRMPSLIGHCGEVGEIKRRFYKLGTDDREILWKTLKLQWWTGREGKRVKVPQILFRMGFSFNGKPITVESGAVPFVQDVFRFLHDNSTTCDYCAKVRRNGRKDPCTPSIFGEQCSICTRLGIECSNAGFWETKCSNCGCIGCGTTGLFLCDAVYQGIECKRAWCGGCLAVHPTTDSAWLCPEHQSVTMQGATECKAEACCKFSLGDYGDRIYEKTENITWVPGGEADPEPEPEADSDDAKRAKFNTVPSGSPQLQPGDPDSGCEAECAQMCVNGGSSLKERLKSQKERAAAAYYQNLIHEQKQMLAAAARREDEMRSIIHALTLQKAVLEKEKQTLMTQAVLRTKCYTKLHLCLSAAEKEIERLKSEQNEFRGRGQGLSNMIIREHDSP
jgi:hypothetical protein